MLLLAGCRSDDDCQRDKACIETECRNPCLYESCGMNAYCRPENHQARCYCKESHRGDPYQRCEPYECLRNRDCPLTLACIDLKCRDPCNCARNAHCDVKNHIASCTCLPGYEGDPYKRGCSKSKCRKCQTSNIHWFSSQFPSPQWIPVAKPTKIALLCWHV